MKKQLLTFSLITSFVAVAALFPNKGVSDSGGADPGYSGSPADKKTCASSQGCHFGTSTSMDSLISSDIPASGYEPGKKYTITAKISASGKSKFGFEVSAQKPGSTKAIGTLANISAATHFAFGSPAGTQYITHAGASNSGQGGKTWQFSWTAPAKGSGDFSFYGSFNIANGNGNQTGDQIVTSSLSVKEDTSFAASIAKAEALNFQFYPNPVQAGAQIHLQNLSAQFPQSASLIDLQGRESQLEIHNQQHISIAKDQPKGIYFLKISSNGKVGLQKLLIN